MAKERKEHERREERREEKYGNVAGTLENRQEKFGKSGNENRGQGQEKFGKSGNGLEKREERGEHGKREESRKW